MLNQRRGKGRRRLAGIVSQHARDILEGFRLEQATREKIKGKVNRYIYQVLRKLAKKYRLTTRKRDNTTMYIEDLAGVLQTNLTTTKKKYTHGRHQARNTFPLPEIIFDPSLALSPHVALLSLIFANNAFLAPSLTSAERISELDIEPGKEQLPLPMKPEMANIPVFRKSTRTYYGWEISPDEQLLYTTLLKWMKRLSVLTGFPQITRSLECELISARFDCVTAVATSIT
ncbi:hypothetical protein B7494_g7492 [Chlorociboria aeruginascens]|nr:hypothetical protein B7494_g7492 [Chlorociboria aeruginascens]